MARPVRLITRLFGSDSEAQMANAPTSSVRARIRSASISALVFFVIVLIADPILMNRPLSAFHVAWMAITAVFIGLIVYAGRARRDRAE